MNEEAKPAEKSKTLVQKLCEAGAAVGWIEKGGYNEFHKYKYATEADIVSTLRGELFKRHVFIFPSIVRWERREIGVESMKWDDSVKAKVPVVRKTALTEVDIEWSFTDGESGEVVKVMVPGVGEDSVDKGLYKAFTGSEKYLLMKSFLLPTGDDPEQDSKEEQEVAKQSGKEAAQDIAKSKLKKAAESTDPKIKKIAEQGLANIEPALFYVWHDESQTAEITGPESLKTANKDLLKPLWSAAARSIICNADQLESLKYELEQRKVKFHPLKAA